MRRILVTGGAGYIGSHCCKALAAAGFEPVVYDNFCTGIRRHVRWGPMIEGDMRDGAALRAAMRETRPEAAIHFAALALVGESEKEPARYWDVNVGGTLRLLEAMHDASVPHLVFSSTCAVYGEPEEVPIREAAPHRPVSPYGASKSTCERMMLDFDRAHGIRSMRLRYFNAAGADPDGEIGEWHEPETHLIPLALQVAAGQRAAVDVFGTDYPTADGTCVRDYIHVEDLAAAHIDALEYLRGDGASATLNCGYGHGYSVREVIAMVDRLNGKPLKTIDEPRRAGDPPSLIAKADRVRQLLRWTPRYDDLEAIVRSQLEWERRLQKEPQLQTRG
jgi:UDP-arabinose 4-epimerase